MAKPWLWCDLVWELEKKNAGTLLRPPIRWALGTAAAPGLPASICLQDPYSLRVVWEKFSTGPVQSHFKFSSEHSPDKDTEYTLATHYDAYQR